MLVNNQSQMREDGQHCFLNGGRGRGVMEGYETDIGEGLGGSDVKIGVAIHDPPTRCSV